MSVEIVERFRGARSDTARVVCEGFHAIKHAVRFGARLEALAALDPVALERMTRELAPDVAPFLARAETVPAEVYAQLAPRPHPTGVVAIARRPAVDLRAILADRRAAPIVVLEDPRRPENLGAAVRVTAAAGAAGLLTLGGADPWHPVAVRGAAGLQFALPVARLESLEELLDAMAPRRDATVTAERRPLIALDPSGEPLRPGAFPPRALVTFGSERRGLSESLLARADRRLAIPMRQGVSSLNLATAVAAALYAWTWSAAHREDS
jgi:TrmH family RNA methyltransferase